MKNPDMIAEMPAMEIVPGGLKRLVALASALLLSLCLCGCNTFEGMGEDVEAAGDKIERTAEEHKNY